jgi:acyl-CoA thioesterase-1
MRGINELGVSLPAEDDGRLLMRNGLFGLLGLLIAVSLSTLSGPARSEAIVITAVGDSNIAGKSVSASDAYPAKLERALRANGYDVRVINAGITGDSTQGVLARLDSAVPAGTKIAIVWVDVNDLRAGVSPAEVEAGRQAIASRLRARGIKVLLLNPRHGLAQYP